MNEAARPSSGVLLSMRWIALFILIANFVYFASAYWAGGTSLYGTEHAQDMNSTPSPKGYSVPTIILLEEQVLADSFVKKGSADTSFKDQGQQNINEPIESSSLLSAHGALTNDCIELGPFSNNSGVESSLEYFSGFNGFVTVKRQKTSENKTYWIVIPEGGADGQEALHAQELGLVVERRSMGRLAGKLAAGPFRNIDTAESYLFRLLAKGTDVVIEPVMSVDYAHWLTVEWDGSSNKAKIKKHLEAIMEHIKSKPENFVNGKFEQNECL